MMRRLLVGVREFEKLRLTPRSAKNGHARRKRVVAGVTHRNRDGRPTGGGREDLRVVAGGRGHVADETRRIAPRRVDDSIELEAIQRCAEHNAEVGAIRLVAGAARLRIYGCRGALGLLEPCLHGGVESPRANQLVERLDRRAITGARNPLLEVVLEAVASAAARDA